MTDQEKEMKMRISMLLDSELDGRDNPRLIDRLESDAELKASWGRYSLIGDVMRSKNGLLADKDFAANISAMIADEPTILVPKNALKNGTSLRPSLVSLGLAASLFAVAILVGKSVNEHSDVFQMASNSRQAKVQVADNNPDSIERQADSQFNDYMVMHNETAYMAGSAGMLPYVRLVASRPEN